MEQKEQPLQSAQRQEISSIFEVQTNKKIKISKVHFCLMSIIRRVRTNKYLKICLIFCVLLLITFIFSFSFLSNKPADIPQIKQSQTQSHKQIKKPQPQPNKQIHKPQKPLYLPSYQQLQRLQPTEDLIIVTHAGRTKWLSILYRYLLKQKSSFYKWHLWANTNNQTDNDYMKKLAAQNNWIKIVNLSQLQQTKDWWPKKGSWQQFNYFYLYDNEQKNKLYLKLDDDICWMQQDFVKKMFEQRFNLQKTILVFSNIINNAIVAHLHQRFDVFQYPQFVEYQCMGNGWKNPLIGEAIHRQFLESIRKNQTDKWRSFKKWKLSSYERFSINTMIYYSQTLRSIPPIEDPQGDEHLYTEVISALYQKPFIVLGNPIAVHGNFFVQRQYFETIPDVYEQFKKISENL